MIRSVVIFLLLIFAAGFALTLLESGQTHTADPCNSPLTYRFGKIDSRFNIEVEQVKEAMKEVESLWSDALDKELVTYSDEGRVVIHFVYGEQQRFFEEERTTSVQIEGKDFQYETEEKKYRRLARHYEENLAQFKKMVSGYNDLVDGHNRALSRLEGKKISSGEQEEIKSREEKISRLKLRLDRKQREVEALRQRVNRQGERLNTVNNQRNELITEYNSRFTEPKKFDQGRYIRKGEDEKINIYQFSDLQSLKAVLAHEVGHALGLNHVENPESVMYELMSEQNVFNLQLSEEDVEALRRQCEG